MSRRPASDLKEFRRFRLSIDVRHEFGERDDLFVNLEHPTFDVCVMVEGQAFDRKNWSKLFLLLLFGRPKRRIFLKLR